MRYFFVFVIVWLFLFSWDTFAFKLLPSIKDSKNARDISMVPICQTYIDEVWPKIDFLNTLWDIKKMYSEVDVDTLDLVKGMDGLLYKVPIGQSSDQINTIITLSKTLDAMLLSWSLKTQNRSLYDLLYNFKIDIDDAKAMLKSWFVADKNWSNIGFRYSVYSFGTDLLDIGEKSYWKIAEQGCKTVLYQKDRSTKFEKLWNDFNEQTLLIADAQNKFYQQTNMLVNAWYACQIWSMSQVNQALKISRKNYCDEAVSSYAKLKAMKLNAKKFEKDYNFKLDDWIGVLLSKGMEFYANEFFWTPIERAGKDFYYIEDYKKSLDTICKTENTIDITKRIKRSTTNKDDILYCINTIFRHGRNGDFDKWKWLRQLWIKRYNDRVKLADKNIPVSTLPKSPTTTNNPTTVQQSSIPAAVKYRTKESHPQYVEAFRSICNGNNPWCWFHSIARNLYKDSFKEYEQYPLDLIKKYVNFPLEAQYYEIKEWKLKPSSSLFKDYYTTTTLMHQAARTCEYQLLSGLIEQWWNVNGLDWRWMTPIYRAIDSSFNESSMSVPKRLSPRACNETIKLLLDNGAKNIQASTINWRNNRATSWTIFDYIVKWNKYPSISAIQAITKKWNISDIRKHMKPESIKGIDQYIKIMSEKIITQKNTLQWNETALTKAKTQEEKDKIQYNITSMKATIKNFEELIVLWKQIQKQ